MNTETECIRPDRVSQIQDKNNIFIDSEITQLDTLEDEINDKILNNYEELLRQFNEERKIVARKSLKISKAKSKKSAKSYLTQREGIEKSELNGRKVAGECQWCAWAKDKTGGHNTMDC